jgi:hypothetical protein
VPLFQRSAALQAARILEWPNPNDEFLKNDQARNANRVHFVIERLNIP